MFILSKNDAEALGTILFLKKITKSVLSLSYRGKLFIIQLHYNQGFLKIITAGLCEELKFS